MRVLFDECVARQLKPDFASVDVTTVQEMGWAGVKNGALITVAAEAGFDAIFTVDRDFRARVPWCPPVGSGCAGGWHD